MREYLGAAHTCVLGYEILYDARRRPAGCSYPTATDQRHPRHNNVRRVSFARDAEAEAEVHTRTVCRAAGFPRPRTHGRCPERGVPP